MRTAVACLALLAALGRAVAESTPGDASGLACVEFRGEVARSLAGRPDAIHVNTLLFDAAKKGCASLWPKLNAAGASPLARDRQGDVALAHAARMGRVGMVAALLAVDAPTREVELNRPDVVGSTPLILAALADRGATAKQLIEAGADVNTVNAQGETALSAAAYNANFELASKLLARGAKAETVDRTGKSPILYAAARGADAIVAALLDAGIDANARYGADLTALMWAAGHADNAPADGTLRTVRLLLARGAKPDLVDDRGRDALMIAAQLGHAEIVRVLLAAGAEKTRKDKTGKTARDLTGDPEIQALLAAP
jgi:ankyrin repeat protein